MRPLSLLLLCVTGAALVSFTWAASPVYCFATQPPSPRPSQSGPAASTHSPGGIHSASSTQHPKSSNHPPINGHYAEPTRSALIPLAPDTRDQKSNGPDNCCSSFYDLPVEIAKIRNYSYTDHHCVISAVILTTKSGRRICVNPASVWVKHLMKRMHYSAF